MNNILSKVIVARFYKINAGFFLFFFIMLFGILNGKATMELHHAIMQAITGSVLFFVVAMVVWTAYNLKCISFFLNHASLHENSFLYRLQSVDNKKQIYLLALCHAAMYQPVLLYAAITAFVGFTEHHVLAAIGVIFFQLLMCAAGTAICFDKINGTWKKPLITLLPFNIFPKKSFPFYLLHYSVHSRKGTFIAVKLFSLLLLQIMVTANSDKLNRESICMLILFIISAHSLLPLYYVRFMESELPFLRNMPLPLMYRFAVYVLTYSVAFLPELLFLLLNTHSVMPFPLVLSLYFMAVAQLSVYTALLYLKTMNTDRYTMSVFVIFFVTLLLLASTNLWLVFAAEAVIAVSLFAVLYSSYEVSDKKTE